MSFLIKDKQTLKKYESIWKTISNILEKRPDKDPFNKKKIQNTNTKILNHMVIKPQQIFRTRKERKKYPKQVLIVFVCQKEYPIWCIG